MVFAQGSPYNFFVIPILISEHLSFVCDPYLFPRKFHLPFPSEWAHQSTITMPIPIAGPSGAQCKRGKLSIQHHQCTKGSHHLLPTTHYPPPTNHPKSASRPAEPGCKLKLAHVSNKRLPWHSTLHAAPLATCHSTPLCSATATCRCTCQHMFHVIPNCH